MLLLPSRRAVSRETLSLSRAAEQRPPLYPAVAAHPSPPPAWGRIPWVEYADTRRSLEEAAKPSYRDKSFHVKHLGGSERYPAVE
ncbi:hypothetical protein GCM10009777_07820 [Microbacterium pumilum]|uniref:Uncharacterized protein n=1 Tax=Microbacterium pumilum TaxID=344165 RepID=A0ABN2RYR8_9MICO